MLLRAARSSAGRLAVLFCSALIAFSLLAVFVPAGKTFGGGIVQSLGTNNNGGTSSCAVTLSANGGVVKNDYIIIQVWVTKGTTVSSVSDGTGGSNFGKVISSAVNVDDEQWIEQYTGNTGSVTVTATLSGSAINKCVAAEIDGLSSKTADATSTGSGTLSASSPWTATVSSFSPPNTDFCYAGVAATETGTVSAIGQAPASPFQNDKTSGTAANGKQLFDYAAWNFDATAFAPTTASDSITTTGLTGGGWDDVIGCYPTATTFTSSTTTSTTTTTTTITTTTTTTTTSTTTTSTETITASTTTTTTTTSTATTTPTTTTTSTLTSTSTTTSVVPNPTGIDLVVIMSIVAFQMLLTMIAFHWRVGLLYVIAGVMGLYNLAQTATQGSVNFEGTQLTAISYTDLLAFLAVIVIVTFILAIRLFTAGTEKSD